jgi:hypothetical protein
VAVIRKVLNWSGWFGALVAALLIIVFALVLDAYLMFY